MHKYRSFHLRTAIEYLQETRRKYKVLRSDTNALPVARLYHQHLMHLTKKIDIGPSIRQLWCSMISCVWTLWFTEL